MAITNRPVVNSLLTVVVVLLLGIATMLWIASNRQQRLEDATTDLRRSVSQQKGQIDQLQKRLEDCNNVEKVPVMPVDTSWDSPGIHTSQQKTVSRTDDAAPNW